jgi:hypothetical protein
MLEVAGGDHFEINQRVQDVLRLFLRKRKFLAQRLPVYAVAVSPKIARKYKASSPAI